MDRFLEKQSVESIKHTMQAQEYIFKQQVRELHRLYNIQKTMMDQVKHRSQHSKISNKLDQTGSREITETTTDCCIEESEIELTLSIGMSSSSSTTKRSSSDTCNNQSNNNYTNNNNNNQEKSRSSTTSLDREKKKRPHNWLLHGLTINPTS
ncbi:unnamed protein product [Cochlearia groenlandica]